MPKKFFEYRHASVEFDGGRGSLLCSGCGKVIGSGLDHEDKEHYCDDCSNERNEKDWELSESDSDEEVRIIAKRWGTLMGELEEEGIKGVMNLIPEAKQKKALSQVEIFVRTAIRSLFEAGAEITWKGETMGFGDALVRELKKAKRKGGKDIPNNNTIETYSHCRRCLKERPRDISPRDWAKLEVGFTDIGIQIWCVRHDVNILHIDFEGNVHPANSYAAMREEEDTVQ